MDWFWRRKKKDKTTESTSEGEKDSPGIVFIPEPKVSRDHKTTAGSSFYQTPNVRPVPRRRSSKRGPSGGGR